MPAARQGARRAAEHQSGLPLDPPMAESAPRAIDPEQATPCAAPFDGDDWLFSIDWEGSRCQLLTDAAGRPRLRGPSADPGARFPEIVSAAAGLAPGTILDGTVCLLDGEGRPDLNALSLRMAGAHQRPAVYLATDLLASGGRALLDRPLFERLRRLDRAVPGGSRIQVPDCVEGHGVALAAAAADHGLSAVVGRRRSATYHPGMASPHRLRVDLAAQRTAVVVGCRGAATRLQVALAELVDGRLTFTGMATVDQPAAVRWFAEVAERVPEPPIVDPQRAGAGVAWVRPRLCATVAITDLAVLSLRVVALRDDVDPRWCVRRSAVTPPLAAGPISPLRRFSPTVLHALPLDAA